MASRVEKLYCLSRYYLQLLLILCLITTGSFDDDAERLASDVQLDSAELVHDVVMRSIVENTTSHKELYDDICSEQTACNVLGGSCINCSFDYSCTYGKDVTVNCTAKPGVNCTGSRTFTKTFNCRYCYQTLKENHLCEMRTDCKVIASPPERYVTNCTVREEILCLGSRKFLKSLECNWTSGYRWTTAVILSLTLGGFGADRFYLGHWKEGLGKLFSFGGLGVWTIVDFILVCIGYIGPADDSLYIL